MERILDWNAFLLSFIPLLFIFTKVGPNIASWSCRWFFLPTKREDDLLSEAKAVKQEMNKMSMVDEFAKYAKLQRRLNQLKLSIESDARARHSLQTSMTRMVTYGLHGLVAIIYIFTLYEYGRSFPVLVIPSKWFFPLNYIFSYPTGIHGAISIPVWSIITKSVISNLMK